MKRIFFFLACSSFLLFPGCSESDTHWFSLIDNSCSSDEECVLTNPELECSNHSCGSCELTIIDNSEYVSVNRESYRDYYWDVFTVDNNCPKIEMGILVCPECYTEIKYKENLVARCIEGQCKRVEGKENAGH